MNKKHHMIDLTELAMDGLALMIVPQSRAQDIGRSLGAEATVAAANLFMPSVLSPVRMPRRREAVQTLGFSVGHKLPKFWMRRRGLSHIRLVARLEPDGWRLFSCSDAATIAGMRGKRYSALSPLVVDLYRFSGTDPDKRTADGKTFFNIVSGLGNGMGRGNNDIEKKAG